MVVVMTVHENHVDCIYFDSKGKNNFFYLQSFFFTVLSPPGHGACDRYRRKAMGRMQRTLTLLLRMRPASQRGIFLITRRASWSKAA